jgi:hypothetical protein
MGQYRAFGKRLGHQRQARRRVVSQQDGAGLIRAIFRRADDDLRCFMLWHVKRFMEMRAELRGQSLSLVQRGADGHNRAPAEGKGAPTAGQFTKAERPRQHRAAPFKRARIKPLSQQQRVDGKKGLIRHG